MQGPHLKYGMQAPQGCSLQPDLHQSVGLSQGMATLDNIYAVQQYVNTGENGYTEQQLLPPAERQVWPRQDLPVLKS